MAHIVYVPYATGEPRPAPPSDYQNIPTTPREFGAQIGAGEERLGEGALKAGQIYGEVATDEQANHVLSGLDDINAKLRSLQGKDRMAFYPTARQQMNDLLSQGRGNLTTANQIIDFDRQTRYLTSRAQREAGDLYDAAEKEWGIATSSSNADLSLNGISKAAIANDQEAIDRHTYNLIDSNMKIQQAKLGTLSDEQRADIVARSQRQAYDLEVKSRLGVGDVEGASRVFKAHAAELSQGADFDAMSRHITAEGDKAVGHAAALQAWGTPGDGARRGVFNAPPGAAVEGANPGEQRILNEIRYRETGGDYKNVNRESGASGAFQFKDETWAEASAATGQGKEYAKASDAPRAVQDANALWLLRNRGTRPWAASGPYLEAGGGTANFAKAHPDMFGGDPHQPGWAGTNLVTVSSPSGATFRVNKVAAADFKGFLNDLNAAGYKPNPEQSYGFDLRNIRGGHDLSEHAYGNAIDINSDANPMGYGEVKTDLPANISQIAARHNLTWGGDWQDRKDPMHFEWAGPGAKNQYAQAGGGFSAEQSPAMASAPTREEAISRIPEGLSDGAYAHAYREVNQLYNRWHQENSSSIAQLKQSIRNGIPMLEDGRSFPYDETQIRRLLPADQAEQSLDLLADAKAVGDQKNAVARMSISEAMRQSVLNHTQLANAPPGEYIQMRRMSNAFDKAADQHFKALFADPVGYITSTNPNVEHLRQLAASEGEAAKAEGRPPLPAAFENYASALLEEQDHLQVPAEQQHVLSTSAAPGMVQDLMSNPTQAPEKMRQMQANYGTAWPAVWHDLVTTGKMPTEFQSVGIIDPHMAMRLTQGLVDERGDEGKKGNQIWEGLFGASAVTGSSGVIQSVRTAPGMPEFITSMKMGGATTPEMDSFLHAVSTTAFSLMAHEGLSQGDAVEKAAHAFTSLYGYMANGGARVPIAQFDNVSRAAEAMVETLSPDFVRVPPQFGAHPGAPTPQDYIAAIKGNPTWVNGHDAIELIDNAGRRVLGRDGKGIVIPFNVAPTAGPAAGAALPPVAVPPM